MLIGRYVYLLTKLMERTRYYVSIYTLLAILLQGWAVSTYKREIHNAVSDFYPGPVGGD